MSSSRKYENIVVIVKKNNPKIFILNKREGETLLEAMESLRLKRKIGQEVKMTYAGRLDPLVSGLLLVLIGENVKEKERYLGLSKEYKFDMFFGFATDTYDILGKVVKESHRQDLWGKLDLEKKIKKNLKFFTGTFMQKYPMYSSKTVAGKPLFAYARAGEVVKNPEHEVSVTSLKFLKLKKMSTHKFLENIERRIAQVKGDFRQEEILKTWRGFLGKYSKRKFFVGSFYIKCGSGTYVRSIANDLGECMGVPSLALTIKRTRIGKFAKITG